MDIIREKEFLLALKKSLGELSVEDLGELNITCDYLTKNNKGLAEVFTILQRFSTEKLWEKKDLNKKLNLDNQ